MISNKFIRFSSRDKTHIFCIHYHFLLFRKQIARFATPLTAQDTSKLMENERNTDRCTTQSSGKGVNG